MPNISKINQTVILFSVIDEVENWGRMDVAQANLNTNMKVNSIWMFSFYRDNFISVCLYGTINACLQFCLEVPEKTPDRAEGFQLLHQGMPVQIQEMGSCLRKLLVQQPIDTRLVAPIPNFQQSIQ